MSVSTVINAVKKLVEKETSYSREREKKFLELASQFRSFDCVSRMWVLLYVCIIIINVIVVSSWMIVNHIICIPTLLCAIMIVILFVGVVQYNNWLQTASTGYDFGVAWLRLVHYTFQLCNSATLLLLCQRVLLKRQHEKLGWWLWYDDDLMMMRFSTKLLNISSEDGFSCSNMNCSDVGSIKWWKIYYACV